MGQALYRKYRSRSFDEVVGQEHITKTLKKALAAGKLSHAYLFTGPRGVGKTSVARILAHEVNQLDYQPDAVHLDIIEIDAASNRRIDEIRDLREKVHISPTSAKYKVYIIDEVHMLTREAFNALLKTLEEPPSHCIFILATTEVHKLPETIISRTQRFAFKPVSRSDAESHLAKIAKQEKLTITPGALKMLAEHGEGSFRDSIGMLDQLGGVGKTIDEQMVQDLLGLPPVELIKELADQVNSASHQAILDSLDRLWGRGANPALVARQLSQIFRQKLLGGAKNSWFGPLLKQLLEVPASSNPRDYLEIVLLEAASWNTDSHSSESTPPTEKSSDKPLAKASTREPGVKQPKPAKNQLSHPAGEKAFRVEDWPAVLSDLKDEGALRTVLRLAEPSLNDGVLTLAFEFPLHQKKAAKAESLAAVEKIIATEFGSKIKAEAVVDKKHFAAKKKSSSSHQPKIEGEDLRPLQTISNIFGSAEVLES